MRVPGCTGITGIRQFARINYKFRNSEVGNPLGSLRVEHGESREHPDVGVPEDHLSVALVSCAEWSESDFAADLLGDECLKMFVERLDGEVVLFTALNRYSRPDRPLIAALDVRQYVR